MKETDSIYEDITLAWNDADDIHDYFYRSYGFLFNFCIDRYVLNDSEFKVHVRYNRNIIDSTSHTIENQDYRYVFIMLCALKSSDIYDILNFIILPTDYFSFTEKSILREIEITKGLINTK